MPSFGFASGFARGIANAMAQSRQRQDRERERRQDMMLKGAIQAIEEGQVDVADLPGMLDFIMGEAPKGKKGAKGGQDPRQAVTDILGAALQRNQPSASSLPHTGAGPSAADSLQGAKPVPTSPPVARDAKGLPTGLLPGTGGVPAAPDAAVKAALTGVAGDQMSTTAGQPDNQWARHSVLDRERGGPGAITMFGVPAISREEALNRKMNRELNAKTALVNRQIQVARDTVFPTLKSLDPKATFRDALAAVGMDVQRLPISSQVPRFAGNVEGAQLPEGTKDFYGRPIDPNQRYRQQFNPDMTIDYLPTEERTINAGTNWVQAAVALGFNSVAEAIDAGITGEQLRKKADELRTSGAKATATGTAQGKFEAPIDIPGSQSSGLPVGTSAAQVEGQVIPTQEQQASIRTGELLQTDLQRLLGDGTTPGLLNVLPSKSELGGRAPGAALALRRRMNTYREDIRRLESVVDSMVNDLARYRGQRGAQTEADVTRAYNALVKLNAGFTDPLGGDTRESATAAIQEAQAGLARVAAAMPKRPVPTASPRSAAAATGGPVPGAVIRDGKLYINGKLVGE